MVEEGVSRLPPSSSEIPLPAKHQYAQTSRLATLIVTPNYVETHLKRTSKQAQPTAKNKNGTQNTNRISSHPHKKNSHSAY